MFRFSCFSNPSHHHRSKSHHQRSKKLVKSLSEVTQTYPNSQDVDGKKCDISNIEKFMSSTREDFSRSEDMNFCIANESRKMKRSISLGGMLGNDSISDFDDINDKKEDFVNDSHDENSFGDFRDPHQQECLSSIGNSENLIEKQCDFEDDLSTYRIVNSEVHSSFHQPVLTRSQSLNLDMRIPNATVDCFDSVQHVPRSKSYGNWCSTLDRAPYMGEVIVSPGICKDASEDCVQSNAQSQLHFRQIHGKIQIDDFGCNDSSVDEMTQCYAESGDDHLSDIITSTSVVTLAGNGKIVNVHSYGDLSHNACNSEDLLQDIDEKEVAASVENCEAESCDMLSPQEFNITRIENWISEIVVPNGMAIGEQGGCSSSGNLVNSQQAHTHSPRKINSKSPLGMEAAYNYTATLKPSSSIAQLSNLGLVAIPILSAFSSLRLLNLSANSIIRITSGAIPKGLHMLNLSRNNISTIEGLRELTRLRVLDLSCNRIAKIGHGLSSCCSLKELYLGDNKISEVEGLHRVLKLKVLDMRSNKIATSKCLGQLANCNTLQSINLEGNPVQRNIGDDHLKKYVLSLLSRLVYYNKQAMRSKCAKEERHGRGGCLERGDGGKRAKRLDLKLPRRSGSPSTTLRTSRSLNLLRAATHGSLKPPKSRNAPLVPSTPRSDHPADGEEHVPCPELFSPIHRIRSAGDMS